MTVFQIIFNDIFLLVLIVGLLFYHIFVQKRLEMKIANIEAGYDLLLESKEGPVNKEGNLEKASLKLNHDFDEKLNTLTQKVNNLAKNKLKPQKASNDGTPERFKAFQESMNKRLEENEKELKKVVEVLKTITLEIKNMKDAIRERTIDLEL